MHEDSLKLAALWKKDQARDALLAERAGLDDRVERTEEKLAEASARLAALKVRQDALRATEREQTRRMEGHAQRRDRTLQLIAEGRAPDYFVAQSQAEKCAELVDELETSLLELMEELEKVDEESAHTAAAQALLKARLEEAKADRSARSPGLAEAIDAATTERDDAREGIFRDLLGRYDQLRARGRAPFADVRGVTCTGCSMAMERLALAEHRRGASVQWCRHCGRFLGEML